MQSLYKLEETSDWNTVKGNVVQGLTGKTGGSRQLALMDVPPGRGVFENG